MIYDFWQKRMNSFPEVESLSCDFYLLVLRVIGNKSNLSFMSHTHGDFRTAVVMNFNSM
jgi:hypothetical protein